MLDLFNNEQLGVHEFNTIFDTSFFKPLMNLKEIFSVIKNLKNGGTPLDTRVRIAKF